MVRRAVFGEFVETHFNPLYAFAVGGVMLLVGLVLISDAGSVSLSNDRECNTCMALIRNWIWNV